MPKKTTNKKILLGITGGIAAYKAAILVRLFIKKGAEVKVVATEDALKFITPLTLSTLSKHPVSSSFVEDESGMWTNHVELGKWADIMVIAPCTAKTLSKMATGHCDNLLIATYLSADCPVFFAPAMDLDMYTHPSTQLNIERLKDFGNIEIESEHGELASGLIGKGRMSEPETIVNRIWNYLKKQNSLSGQKLMVNAGPTYEKIDPVRFLGNRSSGKMGIAIANILAERGALVSLILGPSNETNINSAVRVTKVESADEMLKACVEEFTNCNGAILAAAVADYKPSKVEDQKIKKKSDTLNLTLEKTSDILMTLGTLKSSKQVLVGFALETENEYDNAVTKLQKKNLDFIVLNSLNDQGAGFGVDTNKISIIESTGKSHNFETKHKSEVAADIADIFEQHLCRK